MVSMGFVKDLPTYKDTDLVFTDSKLSDPNYIESVIITLISKIEKLQTGQKHQTQLGHLIRVQSLSLRTTKDQRSLTKERDRRDGGEGTREMELRMTRTR